jgi:hypothetical protein
MPRMLRSIVIAALLASLAPAVAGAATASTKPAAPAAKPSSAPDARVVPFIADDYTKAVAEARARKVPLFIEAWAPW